MPDPRVVVSAVLFVFSLIFGFEPRIAQPVHDELRTVPLYLSDPPESMADVIMSKYRRPERPITYPGEGHGRNQRLMGFLESKYTTQGVVDLMKWAYGEYGIPGPRWGLIAEMRARGEIWINEDMQALSLWDRMVGPFRAPIYAQSEISSARFFWGTGIRDGELVMGVGIVVPAHFPESGPSMPMGLVAIHEWRHYRQFPGVISPSRFPTFVEIGTAFGDLLSLAEWYKERQDLRNQLGSAVSLVGGLTPAGVIAAAAPRPIRNLDGLVKCPSGKALELEEMRKLADKTGLYDGLVDIADFMTRKEFLAWLDKVIVPPKQPSADKLLPFMIELCRRTQIFCPVSTKRP